MSLQRYRVFPFLNGWGVDHDGEWRGPYRDPAFAIQVVRAHALVGQSAGRSAQLDVQDEHGAVRWSTVLGGDAAAQTPWSGQPGYAFEEQVSAAA
jgi:hypothetical protein